MLDPKERYMIEEVNMMEYQLEHERSIVGESFVSGFRCQESNTQIYY
jgi:hypothetical protein